MTLPVKSAIFGGAEYMISKLREYKRNKYLFDTREIVSCGINERGNIEVNWV